MNKYKILSQALLALVVSNKTAMAQEPKPNVLWILTDDHRYDAVRAFNKMLTGKEMSKLGYVESPNIDRLTQMGTTFINTYCQATCSAPSRASMHTGRYPFRSGVFEFEYHNNNAEHWKPTLPEQMASIGYQTFHIGKLGVRLKTVENGKVKSANMYQTDIDFKTMHKDGLTDWGKGYFSEVNGIKLEKPIQDLEFFVTPQGKLEYCNSSIYKQIPTLDLSPKQIVEKYDLLRLHNKNKEESYDKGGILSGVSPQPGGKTRDGYYTSYFQDYLKSTGAKFKVGSQTVAAIDPNKPLFCHLGYDFPHTPVLPPANFRERFQKYQYKIPELAKNELETMPAQHRKAVMANFTDNYSDKEKLKFIQDYYAFCAYGDSLVGQAVNSFIEYSEKSNRPWIIVYVNGDNGWRLNEHGGVEKFTSWELDSHNPIVVVSSDKKQFPAGKVVTDFAEFVDVAPTILAAAGVNIKDEKFSYLDGMDLSKMANGKTPVRDYVVGESHAVTGPRAYIRTKDYVFSMATRPNKTRGQNMEWARSATYKDLDPALYKTATDPNEINNLAYDKAYEKIAMQMKEKLINIVLGDNRVEVGWGPKADGTQIYRSNFAPGAHDYKLKLK